MSKIGPWMGPILFKFQIIILIFTISLMSLIARAQASANELAQQKTAQVIQKARKVNLSSDLQWKRLLHMQENFVSISSQVTGKNFFLSPQGASNAGEELEATVRGFFSLQDSYKDRNDHPQCIFPARKKFISQKLGLSESDWPIVECKLLQRYKDVLKPQSVTFAFSSYFTNSPGSAFGHTFFRIHKKSESSTTSSDLLDHGIGYAAQVGDVNAVIYAISGIFGGFRGEFTNTPYYYKVREYNDYEARDIWDYQLALTPDEIEYLVLHLWELGNTSFTYYFFTQNCAYHMLSTLDASSTRFDFIGKSKPFMLPVDALKIVTRESELVEKISFRPSARRLFLARLNTLEEHQKLHLRSYFESRTWLQSFEKLPQESKVILLDAAMDFIDVTYPEQTVGVKGEGASLKRELLLKRSEIQLQSFDLEIPIPQGERPENGHESTRVGIFYRSQQKLSLTDIEFRFALHEPLDFSEGYPNNSQIEFGRFKLSQLDKNRWYLNQGDFIRAETLNPINFFERKMSWKMNFGMKSFLTTNRVTSLGGGQMGFGFALQPYSSLLVSAMGVGSVYGEHRELGFSFRSYLSFLPERLSLGFELNNWYPQAGISYFDATAELRYHIKNNLSGVLKTQNIDKISNTSLGVYLFF